MFRNPIETEIAIVGAGPAGARAAELLAAKGADVVLLDPKAPWEKPCGGGLTESAFRDVPELEELAARMRPVRTIRVETAADRGFTVWLDHPIRVVSRLDLARWQLDRARDAGATHVPGRVVGIRRIRGGSWWLDTDDRPVVAALVVGADGAASRVRRSVAPTLEVEMAPTRVSYAPGPGPTQDQILLRFFPEVAGYVWDFPRLDHRSVGIGIQSGVWQRPRMDGEVDRFRHSSEACWCADDAVERAGAVIGTAQLGHGDFSRIAGTDFALLGDAAGFADPATGEGIRNALRSAEMLAGAWLGSGTFDPYPRLARKGFEREFQLGRILRRIVFEGDVGGQILKAGQRSDGAQALVAALAGAINEQDASPGGFFRRWRHAHSLVRRSSAAAGRRARIAGACPSGCGCDAPPEEGHEEPSTGARHLVGAYCGS